MALESYVWAEKFYAVLNCPTQQEVCEANEKEPSREDYDYIFKAVILEFPMLQELNDVYSKVLFQLEHIEKFREELLSVIP